jgi:hypothetical protein
METKKSGRMRRTSLMASLVVPVVVAVGCGSSSSKASPGTSSQTTPSQGGTSTAAAGALDGEMATYIGGKLGRATGSPIEIGFVNADSAVSQFPDVTQAAQSAVDYINDHLNGIHGHVIKLDTCDMTSEETGQSCGAKFANNGNMKVVGVGVDVVGGDALFKVINNNKVVVLATMVNPADFDPYPGVSKPNVFLFNAGPFGGLAGDLKFISQDLKPKPKNALVLTIKTPAVTNFLKQIATTFDAVGIKQSVVQVPPTAAGPQVASAIQAQGGGSQDLWIVNGTSDLCVAAYKYQVANKLSPLTVDTGGCFGQAMKAAAGKFEPNNWTIATTGASIVLPDKFYKFEQQVFGAKNANPPNPLPDAHAFLSILNTVRAMNSVADGASVSTIAGAMRNLKEPIADNIGPLACGSVSFAPPICGTEIGIVKSTSSGYQQLVPSDQYPSIKAFTP